MATVPAVKKARLYYHLGYPYAGSAASLAAGMLRVILLTPQLEKSLEILHDEAFPLVDETLELLEALERQRRKLVGDLRVSEVGKLKLRMDALGELVRQYDQAVAILETQIGCQRNPQDPRKIGGSAGSMNGSWSR